MAKLSITDLELSGRRVLVRVDFNVPLQDGEIGDDTRIRAAVPTLRYILERGGIPILMSHLGRPTGRVVPELSLKPAAVRLGELMGREVVMAPDCVGPEVEAIAKRADGVVMLENLRFHVEEEANDPEFARRLCELGSAYVNDAFGTAHRAHASTEGVTHHFVDCAAGFLMQRELECLESAMSAPARPFVAVLGGAKISGKIDVIQHLLTLVDTLLIGGGMAYTFYKAMGLEIGRSLLETDRVGMAEILLRRAADAEVRLLLPTDCVVSSPSRDGSATQVVPRDGIPPDLEGFDIGPDTRSMFSDEILNAGSVVWNGPMGVSELPAFAGGTTAVAHAVAKASSRGANTLAGGGETVAALTACGLADMLGHVSTGGGAFLEYLEGKTLPGVAALAELQA
ncbi:MAG: phosphoglycerate kinase [Gemmatimonadota bacterium]|nr:phosphoglycerate kinase [Gemmatimonadota bacterium]